MGEINVIKASTSIQAILEKILEKKVSKVSIYEGAGLSICLGGFITKNIR